MLVHFPYMLDEAARIYTSIDSRFSWRICVYVVRTVIQNWFEFIPNCTIVNWVNMPGIFAHTRSPSCCISHRAQFLRSPHTYIHYVHFEFFVRQANKVQSALLSLRPGSRFVLIRNGPRIERERVLNLVCNMNCVRETRILFTNTFYNLLKILFFIWLFCFVMTLKGGI